MKRWWIVLMFISCSSSNDRELLQQSGELHDEALAVGKQVKTSLEEMKRFVDLLKNPDKTYLKDSVQLLVEDYVFWESSIVEVPGHDHNHEHHGHDHHDHEPSPGLTAEMILTIQKDMLDQIVRLDERVKNNIEVIKTAQE